MIRVTVYQDSGRNYLGYSVSGHAGYAEHGSDVVCAAVSVLTQNTANSIERFTCDAITGEADEESGYLKVNFPKGVGRESKLLLDSMVSGLKDIMECYGETYIKIRFEEV